MKILTHNDKDINVDMTCLQGVIYADYSVLVKLFGKPQPGGDKSDAEWVIQSNKLDFNGRPLVATIYNWKNGKNYLGDEGEATENITRWNVGGYVYEALTLVSDYIKDNH
jgi:hypothetical protein